MTEKTALVIGSGFGGLAACVRLLARGYRVTVLEKLDAAGGRAYVFQQDGFSFDGGPTIITAPYILEELWTLSGRRMQDYLELRRMDPFYKIRFDDGEIFNASADIAQVRREVARIAPGEEVNFDRYLKDSEAIYNTAFKELADVPFDKLSTLLRAAPDLIRLQGYRTVYSKVSDYFTNPKLRVAFSYHPLLIGGNPLTTTAYYCLIAHLERLHGVHYAMGGTGAVVRALVKLIEEQGGTLRYHADVDHITTSGRRATGVQLATGETLTADIVVSNADAAWTYSKLLTKHPRRVWTDRKLARQSYSMGLFVWYFGTNRKYDDVYHHTIMLGPRFEELLRDIFTRKSLAGDFSLYLYRPTATDPSVAPPGCDNFYALVPVPNLDGKTDWATYTETFRARIQKRLEETVLPGLGSSIVTSRVMTPADFHMRLNSVKGAGMSLEPKLFQSAWFRPHNMSEELENLYLVGAGTHPGAGMPSVILSAKVMEQRLPA
jgi:phytoene desaturase